MRETMALADKLEKEKVLSEEEFAFLIKNRDKETGEYIFEKARAVRKRVYGNAVYIRGLIEFTNYCGNDCLYCGIRKSNKRARRYRLTGEQILGCCERGYALGFRTFVLQGGEDGYFTDGRLCGIVSSIKERFPDCAVTLSAGERSRESYKALFDAGADRYLLRHETADSEHYARLHPRELSFENRKRCLYCLKETGFQTGSGFMVGSPFQTETELARDMLFLHELNPQMAGIGPFIPHKDTPFGDKAAGTAELTLFMLGLLRLMLPCALIPATTALGTVAGDGREQGILSGANVIMPNLSPENVREKYSLYNGKLCTGAEAAEHIKELEARMNAIGYEIVTDRGDYKDCL